MLIKCYHPIPENGKFRCFHVITKAVSVIWTKKFYDIGSFQLSLKESCLQPNDIILHGENCGIVMKTEDTFGGCTVYGYTLKGLTKFRHIYQPQTYAGTAEEIIKAVAKDTLQTGKRKIEGLTIAENHLDLSDSKELICDNVNVADKLKQFSSEEEIGFDITFSESGMVFDVCVGRDMRKKITFSRERRNMDDLTYTADYYNTYNAVYGKKETEDAETSEEYEYTESGNAEGILRREGASDKDAESFLKENAPIQTLRGNANDRLSYGTDWKLGDYVTCKFRNLSTEKQITEVKEVYEKNGCKIIPVFGTEKENIISKILKG